MSEADHDESCKDMSDVPLPRLHQVQVGGIVLLIYQKLVHSNDTSSDGDHGQTRFPGLFLVARIQLREQLLCKALHAHTWDFLQGLLLVLTVRRKARVDNPDQLQRQQLLRVSNRHWGATMQQHNNK